ncbi:transcriptional regulator [Klebsiella aerogenes]|nr:transcriptional regulator [Klebsiella aerogenes]
MEIFGLPRPEMGDNWYQFAVAAVDEGPLCATGGIRLMTDGGPELLAQADTIVVPGWRGVEAPVPEALCAALASAHARGCRIISICSGVFVLAAAGLLNGRQATTPGATPRRCSPVFRRSRWWRTSFTWAMLC